MTSKAAIFTLLSLWGVGSAPCLPAYADDAVATETSDADGESART